MSQEYKHPIEPPPELVHEWREEASHRQYSISETEDHLIEQAAQHGADQELEACCEYLIRCAQWEPEDIEELRAARRPKPPSLKQQALEQLDGIAAVFRMFHGGDLKCDTIRRALEQLND